MSETKPLERPLRMGTVIPGYGKIGAVGFTGGERYYWLLKRNGRDVAIMPWSIVEPLAPASADEGR